MNLTTIRQHLQELQLTPSKSMGQNFLHDQNLARWMVDSLQLQPGEHVVEIGPGLGALTEMAVQRGATMTLIEKDERLANFLRRKFHDAAVEILHQDAARFDVRTLFPKQPVKVIGNLPYYVSTPIISNFTDPPSPASLVFITLQKELALRLAAAEGTADYGTPTVIVQRQWQVKYLRTLPASVFYPAPKVDSAVISLTPRKPADALICDDIFFRELVRAGFSQRRKQLRKLLGDRVRDWPAVAAELGAQETARAEELSVEQWVRLSNLLRPPAEGFSADEPLAVTNAAGEPVGAEKRSIVHQKKLLHRAVHIFLFNQAGNLFLQKRSHLKDCHPGQWDSSAAGHVAAGEGFDETAQREVQEELGVMVALQFVAELPASEMTGWEFIRLYRGLHDGPFTLAPQEIESGAFFPLPILREWMVRRPQDFAPGFLECFQTLESAADERLAK